jgi:hypothetical protein
MEQKNLKIAVNRSVRNKSFNGLNLTNDWENVNYSIDDLEKSVKSGYASCNSQLKSNVKEIKNFECTNSIWLDFDNKDFIMEWEHFINHGWVRENAFAAYTTPSHTSEVNRFRAIFLLPYVIDNPQEYKDLIQMFIHKFQCDTAPSSITQAFFGNTEAVFERFDNVITKESIDKIIRDYNAVQENEQEFAAENLNGGFTEKVIQDALSYIPTKLDYIDWSKICHAVNAALNYDIEKAARLINNWSPGKGNEVAQKLKKPMEKIGPGTLIWYAEYYKWKRPKNLLKKQLSSTNVNSDGKINFKTSSIDMIQSFLSLHCKFRYNEVKDKYEFEKNGQFIPIEDRELNEIWRLAHMSNIKTTTGNLRQIIESEFSPKVDPIKEYFRNLPEWNNNGEIEKFVSKFKVIDEHKPFLLDYWMTWFVATYRCSVFSEPNHYCMVLKGKQGSYKTTIIGQIIPNTLRDYYCLTQINPRDKDSKIEVSTNFIINLDELDESTREEIGHLKSLITSKNITVRKPYGRFSKNYPRRASFIGSVNKEIFLFDSTGSRRFLIIELEDNIDMSIEFDIDQLWAQVKFLSDAGYSSFYAGEQMEKIQELNEAYQFHSQEEELLLKYFEPAIPNSSGAKMLTATEIMIKLKDKEINTKLSAIPVGKALVKCGFPKTKGRIQGKTNLQYYWIQAKDDNSYFG